ncbi:LOW QUALITY PROTEIN: DNA damage-inducible transcript 4 protein [Aplochiton taeniatus]
MQLRTYIRLSSFPRSPVEGSPRRMSWGKLMQRFTEFSAGVNSSIDSDSHNGSRSDLSDFQVDFFEKGWFRVTLSQCRCFMCYTNLHLFLVTGSDVSNDISPCDERFYDPFEVNLLKEIVDIIARSLREAKESDCLRCSKLLIPEKLLEHIGSELLHLAASEPCGLRGCSHRSLVWSTRTCARSVEQIAVDPYLVPTFQLTLVLRLESGGLWPRIQGLFSTKPPSASVVRQAIRLSTGFKIIKKKLYSSEEILVEEC